MCSIQWLLYRVSVNVTGFYNILWQFVHKYDDNNPSEKNDERKRRRSDPVLWQNPLYQQKIRKPKDNTHKRHQKLRLHNDCGPMQMAHSTKIMSVPKSYWFVLPSLLYMRQKRINPLWFDYYQTSSNCRNLHVFPSPFCSIINYLLLVRSVTEISGCLNTEVRLSSAGTWLLPLKWYHFVTLPSSRSKLLLVWRNNIWFIMIYLYLFFQVIQQVQGQPKSFWKAPIQKSYLPLRSPRRLRCLQKE